MDAIEFLDEFRAEAGDHVRRLEEQLLKLEQDPQSPDLVRDMFRSAHTIKGGAALLGIADVLEVAHALEDVLSRLRNDHKPLDAATANLLFEAIDVLRDGIAYSRPQAPSPHAGRAKLVAALRSHVAEGRPARAGATPQKAGARPRALVVDNSATVRKLTTVVLADAGFVVHTVSDGRQGLAEVRSGAYDLLVTAVETDGLNGFELAAAVRSLPSGADLPIVLTSSNDNPEHRRRAEESNVQAYVPKASIGDRRLAEVALGLLASPPSDVAEERSARILLVDDSPVAQMVTRKQLESLEYTVDSVGNGRLAILALARTEYAVILMDCHMPEMDGPETSQEIRRQETGGSHIPIIAMTADTDDDDRARCLAAGMDDFLSKPVELEQLAARLAHWTQRGHTVHAAGHAKRLETFSASAAE